MAILKKYRYEDEDEYRDLVEREQSAQAARPGEYTAPVRKPSDQLQAQYDRYQKLYSAGAPSEFQAIADEALSRIMNREKFSYDLNGDALYQQYKDRYLTGGQLAAQDAVGKASAMTGGYGNSYAASVGQQAYQDHVQGLTDRIPELYQAALDTYNAEGDELYRRYGLASDLADREYDRYMNELGLAYDLYSDAYDRESAAFESDRAFGSAANSEAYDRWLAETGIATDAKNDYIDRFMDRVSAENADMIAQEAHNAEMLAQRAELGALGSDREAAAADRALNDAINRYTYFGDDSALKELGYTDAQIAHLGEAMAEKDSGAGSGGNAPTSAQDTRVMGLLNEAKVSEDKPSAYASFYAYIRTLMASGVSADVINTYLDGVPEADLEIPEVKQAYEELLDYAETL